MNGNTKKMLDELHLRKIDLADEILVLNVDGYIGESTKREIQYASNHNKVIRYLEEFKSRTISKPNATIEVKEIQLPPDVKYMISKNLEPTWIKNKFFNMVIEELDSGRKKHGNLHSVHEGLGVLEEEFWEVKQEIFKKVCNKEKLLNELIQVSAVCLKMAEDMNLLEK